MHVHIMWFGFDVNFFLLLFKKQIETPADECVKNVCINNSSTHN